MDVGCNIAPEWSGKFSPHLCGCEKTALAYFGKQFFLYASDRGSPSTVYFFAILVVPTTHYKNVSTFSVICFRVLYVTSTRQLEFSSNHSSCVFNL
jgi:hypothetical protein